LYFVFISIYTNALCIFVAVSSWLGLPKLSKKGVIVGWVKIKSEHIALRTIKTHVHNIMNKLAVSDRVQAAVVALRSGIVE
jgi:hypothetical protein